MPKLKPALKAEEKLAAQKELQGRLDRLEISIGAAVREIRQKIVRVSLVDYARLSRLSKTTLMNIEREEEDVLLSSVNKALAPIGYSLTIKPSRPMPED